MIVDFLFFLDACLQVMKSYSDVSWKKYFYYISFFIILKDGVHLCIVRG